MANSSFCLCFCALTSVGALFILEELQMKIMSERNQLVLYMKEKFEKELQYALIFKLDENIRHIISGEYFDWCEKMLVEVRQW